jgi:hypothetical protein
MDPTMRPAQKGPRRRGLIRSVGLGPSRARWWTVGLLTVATFTVAAVLGTRGAVVGEGESRLATKDHANPRAGYSFRYPPRWRLQERGSLTRVTSPRKDASVSFGLGGKGNLRAASLRFVTELQETYRRLSLTGFQLTLMDREPAISFTGSGTSDAGVPLRFQAISVAGSERNYTLVVFVAADADPVRVVPPVEAILDSVRFGRMGR